MIFLYKYLYAIKNMDFSERALSFVSFILSNIIA